jgi:hypothetical protein
MNERIKQFAEQAGVNLFEDKSNGWSVLAGTDRHLSKFAELIVRECAGKVDWILAEGGRTQGDLIREHFGVE